MGEMAQAEVYIPEPTQGFKLPSINFIFTPVPKQWLIYLPFKGA